MSWYQTFFTEQYLRGRESFLTPERTVREVEFALEKLALPEGAKVLDLCCGQGRHAVELARRGYQVTGLDLSEFLLERAREAAEETGVAIRWLHCDARENPFAGEFDAVWNMYTAFAYLETDEEDQKVLDGVGRALKPGGKFFLDFINRERVLRDPRPQSWQALEDGTLFLEARRFDILTGKHHARELFLFPDGRREESWHEVRFYTFPELRRMLRQAGMNVIASFGDFDGGEYTLDSRRLILIAEKGRDGRTEARWHRRVMNA